MTASRRQPDHHATSDGHEGDSTFTNWCSCIVSPSCSSSVAADEWDQIVVENPVDISTETQLGRLLTIDGLPARLTITKSDVCNAGLRPGRGQPFLVLQARGSRKPRDSQPGPCGTATR